MQRNRLRNARREETKLFQHRTGLSLHATVALVATLGCLGCNQTRNVDMSDAGHGDLTYADTTCTLRSECTVGRLAIECDPTTAPKIFCDTTTCYWVTTRRPVCGLEAEFDPVSCKCVSGMKSDPACRDYPQALMHFTMNHGSTPRFVMNDSNVTVRIDSGLQLDRAVARCDCTNPAPTCTTPKLTVTWSTTSPGLYSMFLRGDVSLGGTGIYIDVDARTPAMKARTCVEQIFDYSAGCETRRSSFCATSALTGKF